MEQRPRGKQKRQPQWVPVHIDTVPQSHEVTGFLLLLLSILTLLLFKELKGGIPDRHLQA